jgi:O-antigen/teichoic acid export membrane protein
MGEAGQMATRLPADGMLSVIRRGASHPFLRQGGMTLVDQMVASATTFFTGVLIGRACLKEDFGFYMLGFSLLTFLLTLQSSLISTPYTVYIPRVSRNEAPRLTGSSLVQQFVFSISAALGLLVAAGLAWYSGGIRMAWMLLALAVSVSFLLLRDFIRQVCFARLAVEQALVFDCVIAAGQLSALGALAAAGLLNAATAFAFLGLVCAAAACGWLWNFRSSIAVDVRCAARDFAAHWPSAKWLFASGVVWSVSMNLYAWIVAAFHGAASAGVWAAAIGVVTIVNPLMLGAQNFIGPRIMHAYADGGAPSLCRIVSTSSAGYAGILLMFSACMLIAGDALIRFIYGATYSGNGALVALLSLNLACNGLGFTFSRGLFALEQASIDFKVNFVALAAMISCGLLLTKTYGPAGAAIGQLTANGAATLFRAGAFYACARKHGASRP